MTPAQLAKLTSALRPARDCHLAGLPHPMASPLAAALALPLYAYESRDIGCYTCRPGSFAMTMVNCPPGDECRTLALIKFSHLGTVPSGFGLFSIHPGDITQAIARLLTTHYDQIYRDGSTIFGLAKAPDHRTGAGTVPLGTLGATAYALPPSPGPGTSWKKVRANAEEIEACAASLATERPRTPPKALPGLRPLLPLSDGHLAQALACGVLDGPTTLADDRRVVLRGFAGKSSYKKADSPLRQTGGVCDNVNLVVYGERPHLWVRLVDEHGRFETYAASAMESE
jgi:hypothetical protein